MNGALTKWLMGILSALIVAAILGLSAKVIAHDTALAVQNEKNLTNSDDHKRIEDKIDRILEILD